MSESGYTLSPLCQSQLLPLCPPLNITVHTKKKQTQTDERKKQKEREKNPASGRKKYKFLTVQK